MEGIDFVDQWIGVSPKYRNNANPLRSFVIGRDSILTTEIKNNLIALQRDATQLYRLPSPSPSKEQAIRYAQERLNHGLRLQQILIDFEALAQKSVLSLNFNQTQINAVVTQVRGAKTSLNSNLFQLESSIENTKTGDFRKSSTVLAAENLVRNSESALALAKTNANGQVQAAQSQVNLAYASKADLRIRAPFAGTISEVYINQGQQVSPSVDAFKILNPKVDKKAVGYFSTKEVLRMQSQANLSLDIEDQTISLSPGNTATRLDTKTQKMRVEFALDSGEADDLIIGSIGKITLDVDQNVTNILPISAVSFEPDGAEVLVVNDQMITERKKIQIRSLESDGIMILSGIEAENLVVQYRNRFYAGQKVSLPDGISVTKPSSGYEEFKIIVEELIPNNAE